jgi:hypothetical protein
LLLRRTREHRVHRDCGDRQNDEYDDLAHVLAPIGGNR